MLKLLPLSKKWVALLLFLTLLAAGNYGCRKEKIDDNNNNNNNNGSNSSELILQKKDVLPYEYMTIQFPDGATPSGSAMDVKVGDSMVRAYPSTDGNLKNTYQLYLPELAQGAYKISTSTSDGKQYQADITMKALPNIGEVEAYLTSVKQERQQMQAEVFQQYDARVKAGHMRQSTVDSIKSFVQQVQAKADALTSKLTEDEKRSLAYALEANKGWVNEYLAEISALPLTMKKAQDCSELDDMAQQAEDDLQGFKAERLRKEAADCRAHTEEKRVKANSAFMGKVKTAHDAALEDANGRKRLGWVKAYVGTFVSTMSAGLMESFLGLDDLKKDFAALSVDDEKQKSGVTFINGESADLAAGITFVNLNKQDASKFADFAEAIADIELCNTEVNTLSEYMPYVPSFAVPQRNTGKHYVDGYQIDQISDPRISVSMSPGGKGTLVKFKAEDITDPSTSFTFRLSYTTDYGTVSKTVQAELKTSLINVLTGGSPWKVTNINVDGQNLFQLHKTGNHICDNTTYWDETRVLEGSMSIAAGGSGSMTLKNENHVNKFNEGGGSCTWLGKDVEIENENLGLTWTYNEATSEISIPELANDDEYTYKLTYSNNVFTLTSPYVEVKLEKK